MGPDMRQMGWHEVVLTSEANEAACGHLLQHYRRGRRQEDLCFGLWTPSTGMERETAIVTAILLPAKGERNLHGNASFEPTYLARATRAAIERGQGLVFMHSHPSAGWQDMSTPDIKAEQGRIADTARATGKPLVGMTVGTDGHWSARVWKEKSPGKVGLWSRKVRVLEKSRLVIWERPVSEGVDRRKQRRTIESWGEERQRRLEALRVGIVGLGSVGSVVAEGLARTGIRELVLIDHDIVEPHNLDRLLNASMKDIGRPKTDVAEKSVRRASTAGRIRIINHRRKIQDKTVYASARDCDILVSCVDSPLARDILNRIACRDAIPVVDGGVEVRKDPRTGNMNAARWKAHVVNPYTDCLRCKDQYTSSDVMLEMDGSWRNPSYIRGSEHDGRGGENVFCLSLSVGSELLNMVLRLPIAEAWWPNQEGIERNLVTGRTKTRSGTCHEHCTINREKWLGDGAGEIGYLVDSETRSKHSFLVQVGNLARRLARRQWQL